MQDHVMLIAIDEKHREFVATGETCAPQDHIADDRWGRNGCPPKNRQEGIWIIFPTRLASMAWWSSLPHTSSVCPGASTVDNPLSQPEFWTPIIPCFSLPAAP
jgi:hypothetical protein